MLSDLRNVIVDGPYFLNELTFWFAWGQKTVGFMWDTGETMVKGSVYLERLPGWAVDLLLEWDNDDESAAQKPQPTDTSFRVGKKGTR